MARMRSPLLTRFLFLLAWFQVMGPAVLSVADAWRLDKREASVHMEAETGPGCALVHGHDCRLCSIATGPNGTAPVAAQVPQSRERATVAPTAQLARRNSACGRAASQRAPPVMSV